MKRKEMKKSCEERDKNLQSGNLSRRRMHQHDVTNAESHFVYRTVTRKQPPLTRFRRSCCNKPTLLTPTSRFHSHERKSKHHRSDIHGTPIGHMVPGFMGRGTGSTHVAVKLSCFSCERSSSYCHRYSACVRTGFSLQNGMPNSHSKGTRPERAI
jgi:hypothetical protein